MMRQDMVNAREMGPRLALHQLILSQERQQTQRTHRLQTQGPQLRRCKDYPDFSETAELGLPERRPEQMVLRFRGPTANSGDRVVLAASEANPAG